MLLTPHILTGVLIISKVQNPYLGLLFVLLSHYFLDLFPQTEYTIENIRSRRWKESKIDFVKVFLDIALGFAAMLLLVGYNPLFILAALVAIAPDGLTLLHCIFPNNKPLKKHMKMHGAINSVCANKKLQKNFGVLSQIIVIGIAICFLI